MKNVFITCIFVLLSISTMGGQSASLEGKVVDAAFNSPVPYSEVLLYQYDDLVAGTYSDHLGKYRIDNLKPGNYNLHVSRSDYTAFKKEDVRLLAGKEVGIKAKIYQLVVAEHAEIPKYSPTTGFSNTISADQIRDLPIRKVLDKNLFGELKGHVVDEYSLEPILFAEVKLLENDSIVASTHTDFSGNYEFKHTQSGRYVVQIKYLGYHTLNIANVPIRARGITPLNMKMSELGIAVGPFPEIITNLITSNCSSWSIHVNNSHSESKEVYLKRIHRFRIDPKYMNYYGIQHVEYNSVGGCGGKVINDANQEVLTRHQVNLYHKGELIATTKTDTSGNYYFQHLVSGNYYLEVVLTKDTGNRVANLDIVRGVYRNADILVK